MSVRVRTLHLISIKYFHNIWDVFFTEREDEVCSDVFQSSHSLHFISLVYQEGGMPSADQSGKQSVLHHLITCGEGDTEIRTQTMKRWQLHIYNSHTAQEKQSQIFFLLQISNLN